MENHNNSIYETRIIKALRKIIRAVDVYSRKINAEFGLTTPQLMSLQILANSDEMPLAELVQELNLSASTVNGIVDRLEAKNYVARRRSTIDRRMVFVNITELGLEVVSKSPPVLQDKLLQSLTKLSDKDKHIIANSIESIGKLMESEEMDTSVNTSRDNYLTNKKRNYNE